MAEIHFQLDARELSRHLWFRYLPRILLYAGIFIAIGVLMIAFGSQTVVWAGSIPILWGIFAPLKTMSALTEAFESDPVWTEPTTLQFDREKIIAIRSTSRGEMTWARFQKFTEDSDFLYLGTSKQSFAMIIPKEAFNHADLENFKAFAKAGVRERPPAQ